MPFSEHPTSEPQSPENHALRDAVFGLQDRAAAALGIVPESRTATVVRMLDAGDQASAGYWLQLLLAMGIASLGLSLSSTAVVIGAMLISPLMSPIVAFGMGLAVGSPLLVIRSLVRTFFSVVLVVVSAAVLMRALPFAEVTPEIAARTSPTALDLLVAVFCALAAAYATVRQGSDTTSTAAGTAIGIALVPPLCVVGYGLGTGAPAVASGAALLFTANFCAILLFAVLGFLLLGYSRVKVSELEQEELARHSGGATAKVVHLLRFLFGLRHGGLVRVAMPLVLVALVFVPLREALARVTWQVRVRAGVQQILATLPQATVRSSVTVEGRAVSVRLLTLGRAEDAQRLSRDLRERVAALAGVMPKVEVVAVPDAAMLDQLAESMKRPSAPVEVTRREPQLADLRDALEGALGRTWPAEAGRLVSHKLVFRSGRGIVIEVVHLGPELGAGGTALLGQALSKELGGELGVREVALPADATVVAPETGAAWASYILEIGGRVHGEASLRVCVEQPAAPRAKPARKEGDLAMGLVMASPLFREGRLEVREGAARRLWVAATCFEQLDGGAAPDASGALDGGT